MFVLASKSPRRAELFGYITDNFEILPSENEENIPDELLRYPEKVVEHLASEKAGDVFLKRAGDTVIGSDTIVVADDGEIMGKPADEADAERMLRKLSGTVHFVYTGVCVKSSEKTVTYSEKTEVEFYPLSQEEINVYISTGEPFDKAGGYGIQGLGSLLIKKINGDYYNVMGLPVASLSRVLRDF